MLVYYYYRRGDSSKEQLGKCLQLSRAKAAVYFADRKKLPLKEFLKIFEVSK
jgi:hypothetical protein